MASFGKMKARTKQAKKQDVAEKVKYKFVFAQIYLPA